MTRVLCAERVAAGSAIATEAGVAYMEGGKTFPAPAAARNLDPDLAHR